MTVECSVEPGKRQRRRGRPATGAAGDFGLPAHRELLALLDGLCAVREQKWLPGRIQGCQADRQERTLGEVFLGEFDAHGRLPLVALH